MRTTSPDSGDLSNTYVYVVSSGRLMIACPRQWRIQSGGGGGGAEGQDPPEKSQKYRFS